MSESVRMEVEGGVAVVTIDRPPVNALRFADIREINELFKEIEKKDDVNVVVLTGAGERAFVAGTDVNELAELTAETATENTADVQDCVNRIYELPQPVIAAINGPAIGSGVAFASAADIRLASTKANLHLPEVNLGVLGGSKHMARIAPQSKTRQMMYTGKPMDAAEGYRLGVFESVHEPGDLMDAAMALATEIASKLPVAVRMAKVGLNRTEFMPLQEGYAFECELTAELRNDPASAQQSREFIAGGIKR
jgi:enoyl-CoA hydratase